jgi:hypothetical protein
VTSKPIPARGNDDDRRVLQQMLGFYGGPAFARRARRMEDAERYLAEHLHRKREELLSMVALRIGQLRALAGDWTALRPLLASAEALDSLREQHDILQPQLRLPIAPTRSLRMLRNALAELRESIDAFNERWRKYVTEFDLTFVNGLREGYNKHYLIEKECALGNSRVARMGFKRLDPLTTANLLHQFPLLTSPLLAVS